MHKKVKVFQLLVDNTSGVLSLISGLFSRRGYNIESISAGGTADPRYTRITIVASGDDEILDQIARLREETGMTVILVSHSMEDVAKYVDRIIVMNKGQVKFDGRPREVFRHYKELEEIGLAAPQVTYIMQTLKKNGLDVDTDITTIEEAKNAILKALARQRREPET